MEFARLKKGWKLTRVQCLLLALGAQGINGQEGELGSGPVASAAFEAHGRNAEPKVNASCVSGTVASITIASISVVSVVVVIVAAVVVSTVVIVSTVVVSGVAIASTTSGSRTCCSCGGCKVIISMALFPPKQSNIFTRSGIALCGGCAVTSIVVASIGIVIATCIASVAVVVVAVSCITSCWLSGSTGGILGGEVAKSVFGEQISHTLAVGI